MNWEQLLKNIGAASGILVLIILWLGQGLWMRVEADKRNMAGWLWALVGILFPVVGLFFFMFWRMRYPIMPEVAERDEVIEETSRTKVPFYTILQERAKQTPAPDDERTNSLKAALEAEERAYRRDSEI
jgi:hypothetical protein